MRKEIIIDHNEVKLHGHISGEVNARSWIVFSHGSGSSRLSPRNNWIANELNCRGHATLLFDLLTPEEDLDYKNRFNIPLLADRLTLATMWLLRSSYYHKQPVAYFGASTGAGAALIAASKFRDDARLFTVISRGGRPDLAGKKTLRDLTVPVLLIVGIHDSEVINLNEVALANLRNANLHLIDGATHLFEEPGKLNEVVKIATEWLDKQHREFHHPRRSGSIQSMT